MYKGKYGITQQSGRYTRHDFKLDPENTLFFRAIYLSLIVGVIVCVALGWMI
jgi:hypothetical protein